MEWREKTVADRVLADHPAAPGRREHRSDLCRAGGVAAWQSRVFSDKADETIAGQRDNELDSLASQVYQLVSNAGAATQESVNRANTVLLADLAEKGGLQLGGPSVTWNAVNQVTQKARSVSLPRVSVDGTWLGQNRNVKRATPTVDSMAAKVGGAVTIFQRMNADGDLLRVATNVPNADGQRAIGTYIPSVGADGAPNAVVAAIKAGKPYRGVAQVVGTWYVTAYDPLKNADGDVVGAVFFGVPQADAIKELTESIAATKIGQHGGISIYSNGAADRGRIIASGCRPRRATSRWRRWTPTASRTCSRSSMPPPTWARASRGRVISAYRVPTTFRRPTARCGSCTTPRTPGPSPCRPTTPTTPRPRRL